MRSAVGLIGVFVLCVAINGAMTLSDEASKQSFNLLKSSETIKLPEQDATGPLPEDLNPEKLIKILGKDYDPQYTALTRAETELRKKNESRSEAHAYRKSLLKTMPDYIKQLDFKMPGARRNLGPKASRKLQLWLWNLSSCPVVSKWKDNGVRFWPRYRNHGRCARKSTCSFPRGMKCKRSKTKRVALLRWHCVHVYSRKPGRICTWSKFFVSVIAECSCQCSNRDRPRRT